ncbi:arylsulfotransferase family protein [Alphaproteobacteria bacterium]|nr:arylsulfotransferase family protein [Alphaproteobacteria bacterium]
MLEKFLSIKIELRIILLLSVFVFIAVCSFGFLVKKNYTGVVYGGSLQTIAVFLADLPENVKNIFNKQKLNESLARRRTSDESNNQTRNSSEPFVFLNNQLQNGYILASFFDIKLGSTKTALIDIKSETLIHEWYVDKQEVAERTKLAINPKTFRSQHPLMLPDGSLIFTEGEGPLVKINRCSELEWVLDRHTHHSINVIDENRIIINTVPGDTYVYDLPVLDRAIHKPFKNPIRDDGYAIVDINTGEVIEEVSLLQIFEKNELMHFVKSYYALRSLEVTPAHLSNQIRPIDIFHLNDAEFVQNDEGILKKGDVILSIRNLHMVMVYRPSSNKVIKYRVGPWTYHHDADYKNGRIMIFGNDALYRGRAEEYSSVYSWDLRTDEVEKVITLDKQKVALNASGLVDAIPEGKLFFDVVDRLYVLDREGTNFLELIFPLSDSYNSVTHWSRYIEKIEKKQLQRLGEKCS